MKSVPQSAPLLFLSLESPWPAHSGIALRTWGLLRQLGRRYAVDLVVLSRRELSDEQRSALAAVTRSVTRLPLRDGGWRNRAAILARMAGKGIPYHPAVLRHSLAADPETEQRVRNERGIVFTNTGHWGTFVLDRAHAPNWILNQCDADIQFWKAYAAQAANPLVRLAALANYRLARRHFPSIYRRVGRIISVSEDDRDLTLPVAGGTPVDVIFNGIDAAAYKPQSGARPGTHGARLLFTGTSARRNVTALRDFADKILPAVRALHPEVRLLVAGNFTPEAQALFSDVPEMQFTGRVPDIAPYFEASDIFVAPFRDAHGSKLKVAEALIMALPVVATEAGVRGFPVKHEESVLVAKDDADFARLIVRLIEDPAERERIGRAARTIALKTLDWDILGERAAAIVESVRAGLSSATTPASSESSAPVTPQGPGRKTLQERDA